MFNLSYCFKTSVFCVAALICVALAAQEKRKVAVLQPEGNAAVTTMNKANVRGALTEILVKTGAYTAISRNHVDQILKEQGFQRTELTNSSKAKQLGELLGADLICVTELLKDGGEFNIECSIVDVESGEITNSASEFLENDSNAYIRKAVEEIVSRMFGAETPMQKRAREEAENTEREARLNAERAEKEAKEADKREASQTRRRIGERLLGGVIGTAANAVGNKISEVTGGAISPPRNPNRELASLEEVISGVIWDGRPLRLGNLNKANFKFEVDFSGVTLDETGKSGTYSVSGYIKIKMTNLINRKQHATQFTISQFLGTDMDLIKGRITQQVKSGAYNIFNTLYNVVH